MERQPITAWIEIEHGIVEISTRINVFTSMIGRVFSEIIGCVLDVSLSLKGVSYNDFLLQPTMRMNSWCVNLDCAW